jgi:hypothetical protein
MFGLFFILEVDNLKKTRDHYLNKNKILKLHTLKQNEITMVDQTNYTKFH